jgi:hypothetical protein
MEEAKRSEEEGSEAIPSAIDSKRLLNKIKEDGNMGRGEPVN